MLDEMVIWFIDEDERDLRAYAAALTMALYTATSNTNLKVKTILAKANQEDYLKEINNTNTVSILIDQRLKETGQVAYTGIELAKYFRGIYSKLPIYILTAFPDDLDFEGEEWSIESIFSKDFLTADPSDTNLVIKRLLRHIDVHQDILDQQEARYIGLLNKSLSSDLDKEEMKELERLRLERTLGIITEELGNVEKIQLDVEKFKNLSHKIEEKIEELERKISGNGN